jgi:ribonucleoside-diphosphate reductase beta chain
MTNRIINLNQINWQKQPLFFGERLGLQTYENPKYPALDTLNKRMMEMFWKPEEISLQKDRNDWDKLTEVQQDVFVKNLSYQIMLDSVQGRGPVSAILPLVSLPELEGCVVTWDFFETIHSRSYTYLIKNLFAKPELVFDQILDIQPIIERAATVTQHYDKLVELSLMYQQPGYAVTEQDRKTLMLALTAINILEGVRFYVSFACAFALGELNLMEGNAKIITLIARDEAMHLSLTQQLIKILRDREGYGDVFESIRPQMIEMFDQAAQEEKRWAEYLFRNGSMIGLNAEMLGEYVEWIVNRRSQVIGLGKIFPEATAQNPLPWVDGWLGSKNVRVAPQETEISSYLVSAINQDVTDDIISELKI